MPFELAPLPYDYNSLNPHISANTLQFHHDKHHAAYVNKLNDLVKGTEFENQCLTDVVKNSFGNPNTTGIFNNAAQDWNHTFYWRSMRPNGGGEPQGKIRDLIIESYHSIKEFNEAFSQAGLTQFGSGWTWLAEKNGKVSILKTGNAENPITQGYKPLVTCDVWEHAYYLDYQNRRADYITTFLNGLVNWDFANALLEGEYCHTKGASHHHHHQHL